MLASREDILKINPLFSTILVDLQLTHYKPNLYKKGDCVSFGKDDITVLTEKLAQKLNQEEMDHFLDLKDELPFEEEEKSQNFCGNGLYKSSKKDPVVYLNELAIIIDKIRSELNEPALLVLGLVKRSWFQENDYPPVQKAMNYLSQYIPPDFEGGFILKEKEIRQFIPNLFWLIRCNMSLPEIYLSFPQSKIVFFICKYGILHFDFYDKKVKSIVQSSLHVNNFIPVQRCNDPVEFDHFEGRTLIR